MAGLNNQNTQQPRKKPVTIGGYPEAVHDLMRAKYPDYDQVMNGGNGGAAVVNGGTGVNFFGNGGGAAGKFEAQPIQTGPAPITNFTQMPKQEEFTPQSNGNANPALGPVQTPYMGDAAENTPQPQSNFEGMPQPSTGWNADGTPRYDTLSTALSGFQMPQEQQIPEFEADPKQRDGGFFSWLGKVIPKSRPGMREGETPDEYDRRITTNRENIAAFADALRHMGNIINTSKGAPLQVFNDPTAMMEQGYQNRKAQRQKQAALDADAAYKQANLSLKQRAAEVAEAYKKLILGYRDSADKRAQKQFEYQIAKDAAEAKYRQDKDKQNQSNWERQFNFRQQQARISNSLRQQSINKRGSGRSGGGRSGSGGGYPLYNPVTGKTEYFKNEKSWISRAAELGYDTTKGNSTSITTDTGVKKETTNRSGTSVATKIGQQTAQKKAAAKGKTGGGKSSGGKLGGKKYH